MTKDNNQIKEFISKVKETYKSNLKDLQKNWDISEKPAKISGIFFWISEWLELFDENKIRKRIDSFKNVFLKQKDIFLCGKLEWLVIVYRLIKEDDDFYKKMMILTITDNYNKKKSTK